MRLIDADALKDKTKSNFDNLQAYFPTHFIEEIDNAPTVEVGYLTNCANCERVEKIRAKRPQGKWIEHYSKEMNEKGYFICSRCKCGFQRFERGIRHSDLPWIDGQKYELHCIDNFCPNCGADMHKGGAE